MGRDRCPRQAEPGWLDSHSEAPWVAAEAVWRWTSALTRGDQPGLTAHEAPGGREGQVQAHQEGVLGDFAPGG